MLGVLSTFVNGEPMAANEIHVGDIGTVFQMQLQTVDINGNAVNVDVSSASVLQMIFTSAAKRRFVVSCVKTTDGTDGNIQYATQSGDLDINGRWQVQAFIEIGSGQWYSDITVFTVNKNL